MADGGKNKKYKRMKLWCAAYKSAGRFEKNRKRRMLRHLKNHPRDEKNFDFYQQHIGVLRGLVLNSKGRKRSMRA